jgi:hypothetical protein
MFTVLEVPPHFLDKQEQNFVAQIREHGWTNTQVGGAEDRPGFSYTTGFWLKFNHPELIVFALRPKTAHGVFWNVYRALETGKRLVVGEFNNEIFENVPSVFLPVSRQKYSSCITWSRWFYAGDNFECFQLVHPDPHGHFPWSPGISEHELKAQPDLTEGNWSGLRDH